MTLSTLLHRWQKPKPRDIDLIRARLFRRTTADPVRVLKHRVAQCGRLALRLRRATIALEQAIVAVHEKAK